MSDFVQTMKDWRRMCDTIQSGNQKKDVAHWCECCPIESYCILDTVIKETTDTEIVEIENKVQAWADANPEPKYPSWYAWLANMSVVPIELPPDKAILVTDIGLLKPIPKNIAEMYGIPPKEG